MGWLPLFMEADRQQREAWEEEDELARRRRIKERADQARPYVSMTPGQAETLRKAQVNSTKLNKREKEDIMFVLLMVLIPAILLTAAAMLCYTLWVVIT